MPVVVDPSLKNKSKCKTAMLIYNQIVLFQDIHLFIVPQVA